MSLFKKNKILNSYTQSQKNNTDINKKNTVFNDIKDVNNQHNNFEIFASDFEPITTSGALSSVSIKKGEIFPVRASFSLMTNELQIPDEMIENLDTQLMIIPLPEHDLKEHIEGVITKRTYNDYYEVYKSGNLLYQGYMFPKGNALLDASDSNTNITYSANWFTAITMLPGDTSSKLYNLSYAHVLDGSYWYDMFSFTAVSSTSISGIGIRATYDGLGVPTGVVTKSITASISDINTVAFVNTQSYGNGWADTTIASPFTGVDFNAFTESEYQRAFLDSNKSFPLQISTYDNELTYSSYFNYSKDTITDMSTYEFYQNKPSSSDKYLDEYTSAYSVDNGAKRTGLIKIRDNVYKVYVSGSFLLTTPARKSIENTYYVDWYENEVEFDRSLSDANKFTLTTEDSGETAYGGYVADGADINVKCSITLAPKINQTTSDGKRQ